MNTRDHPAYLPGDKGWKRLLVRPATFWTERPILLRLGERVVLIDPSGHALLTTCGEGTSRTRSISVAYPRAGQIIAFDDVNSVKDHVQGRKLVLDGAPVPPDRLADPSVPLKEMT